MTKFTDEMRADMDKLYNFVKQNQPVYGQEVVDFMNIKYTRLMTVRRNLTKEGHYITNQNPYSLWFLPAEMTEEQTHQYNVIKANQRSMNQWQDIIWSMPGVIKRVVLTPEQEEQRRIHHEARLFEERSDFVQKVYDVSLMIEDEMFEPHDELKELIENRLDKLVHMTYNTKLDELKLVMSRMYFGWMQYKFGEALREYVSEVLDHVRHELVEISFKYELKVDIIG